MMNGPANIRNVFVHVCVCIFGKPSYKGYAYTIIYKVTPVHVYTLLQKALYTSYTSVVPGCW